MFDWDENDRFSAFDDSDRFEEDSLCSWMSEPESVCNNWRGWKKDYGRGGNTTAAAGASGAPAVMAHFSGAPLCRDSKVLPLVELAAREVACNIPFEVVEHNSPPVPEELQLRIAYWSFPENEEDIRLYSCLANGSAEEFMRGENLLKARAVKDLLQIGFHLSATVVASQPMSSKGSFNVAVTFDRRRITSCNCTCTSPPTSASWCSHVVSVCLFRIHQSTQVCLRAPVSESLSRLHRDQLQKFAQYLISELPQQILPTAQRLLDELLSSQQTAINTLCGAPDPTAGASANEQTSWCLDENQLHENIKKILIKLCVPSPIVFSDVNYLTSTAPPAAAEWASLLRPLRGREPEGMWNLLSIVREMFRRGDMNAIPLLEILTGEVLNCDQIVLWWFNTRVSLHPGGGYGARASIHSNTHTSQHACSSLCDEIVVLWRLACLNPGLSPVDKDGFYVQLHEWHIKTLDRVSKLRSSNGNGVGNGGGGGGPSNGNGGGALKKTDFEVFPGFKPALEACLLRWDDYPIRGVTFSEACNRKWFCSCVHATQKLAREQGDKKEVASVITGSSSAVLNTCANLRGRGRSVEIGPCMEWNHVRGAAPSASAAAVGPSVASSANGNFLSSLDAANNVQPQSVINQSSSVEKSKPRVHSDIATVEHLVNSNSDANKKAESNRSSFSSEGFCENSETELFEADVALAKAMSVANSVARALGEGTSSERKVQDDCELNSSSNSSIEDGKAARSEIENKSCDTKNPEAVSGPSTSPSSSTNNVAVPLAAAEDLVGAVAAVAAAAPEVVAAAVPSSSSSAGGSKSSKKVENDKYSVIVKKTDDPLEILFARAEALHAHGFTREACRLAVQLAEEMLTNPPNLMVELPNPPTRGKRARRFNPACHQISLLASTTLSKTAFLCSVLAENAEQHHLAFQVGLFGMALARPPASTKALEVKLANQEMDLVNLLKKMPLMSRQLQVLREKAEQLRDGRMRSRGDSLLPLVLASYIFDALVLSVTQPTRSGPAISGRQPADEILGFEAAVAALGLKANVSEAEHPLLCEGTRRQRGDLAITLLIYYKDDQEKLAKIMDRLLDKEVHQMYKNPSNNVAFSSAQSKTSSSSSTAETASPVSNASSSGTTSTASTTATVQQGPATGAAGAESLSSSNSDESLESRDQVAPASVGVGPSGESGVTYPRDSRPRPSNLGIRPNEAPGGGPSSPMWDEDYKAWEARFRCTNLKTANKKHSVGMASIDSSAPETTSSDNSPTVVRRSLWAKGGGPGSDSGSSAESSDSFASSSSGCKLVVKGPSGKAGGSGAILAGVTMSNISTAVIPAEGSQTGVVTITNRLASNCTISSDSPSQNASSSGARSAIPFAAGGGMSSPPITGVSSGGNIGAQNAGAGHSSANNSPPAPSTPAAAGTPGPHGAGGSGGQPMKPTRFKGKRPYPSIPNQPSEASAHFMFELAKNVLGKAGGNSNTAVLFTQQTSGQSHRGPHRALHMCAFQIGVYALGLHNAVSPNWLSRTYSSHVSWITGQAMEIGAGAISFLIETWEGHLTPPEVASLADRASRGRDPAMVRAAAALALSCLPHAHALNPNEIQRALIQCKEQSSEMLERACVAVESAAKGGGVYPEVLFEVARQWYVLYEESLREPAPPSNARTSRRAPYVQASIGEFQVPVHNPQPQVADVVNYGGNAGGMVVGHDQQQQNFLGQNMVQTQPGNQGQPALQVISQCGAPGPFGMPPGAQAFPYGFYPTFPAAPQLALHPAYISNPGGQAYQYNPYYGNPNVATTTAAAVVAAAAGLPPHLRGVMQGQGPIYAGQPMLQNMVAQAALNQAAQSHRFQMLIGQMPQGGMPFMAGPGMVHPNHMHIHGLAHHHPHPQQNPTQALNQRQLAHLLSAYRVGMLALETLARRVVDDRPQTKYARNPSYGEDVKWLLNCAKKLGASYLQDFCICAVNSVASPFVLYDIIVEASRYLTISHSPNQPQLISQPFKSTLIVPLLQKCQQMFISCTHFKMYHITPADYEEFVQVVRAARAAFQMSPGGMVQFNELLQSLRRSKSCKKDLWQHLSNSLQQLPQPNNI